MLSPDRTISERSTRTKRSKLCLRNPSRDSVNKDLFGFKPFASKQIIIMISKEGAITCEYDHPNKNYYLHDRFNFIIDIVDHIIDQVHESTVEQLYEKDKHGFVIVTYPNNDESIDIDKKVSDYLDTIEENDTTMSMESGHDVLNIINEGDSDGLINDKMLVSAMEIVQKSCDGSDLTDSSNNKAYVEENVTMCSSGDRI
ncbi:uncharacterized protein LOC128201415 isoform X2 [Galleria mellonella]|nr:uncharacterized protein LOC128201415 isoform X2 [Galleria mellonella]